MALIVQKFGGTSVANVNRIDSTSKIIEKEIAAGNKVIVVVSAMAGVTDSLVKISDNIAGFVSKNQQKRELDAILSSGEAVSAGLMALSLQKRGIHAVSLQSWQIPICTTSDFSAAKITQIDSDKIIRMLESGVIPVICGFQGVADSSITTFGRGGSDTTAIAIAASVDADRCDIYTDVDGIYTCDPNLVPFAKRINMISYNEIITMAHAGAKVLHPRAAQIGKKYNMKMRVLSSLSPSPKGTEIVNTDDYIERPVITGIAQLKNMSLVKAVINMTFLEFAERTKGLQYNIESIEHMKTHIVACISILDKDIELFKSLIECEKFDAISGLNKIAVVGYGIKNDNEIVEKVFKILNLHKVDLVRSVVQDISIHLFIKGDTAEFISYLHKELIN